MQVLGQKNLINMKQTLFIFVLFSFLLCSCKNETTIPTENLNTPIIEVTIEPTISKPTVEVTPETIPSPEVPETEKVIIPKLVTIYLDIDWEEITEVYFNGVLMTYGPYDNDCEFIIEIEAESVLEVDLKQGETYIIKDITWTYQWDNEEQKWYTCTINKL